MKKALFIGIMAAIFMIVTGPIALADDQSEAYVPKYVIDQGGQDCVGKTPEECIKLRSEAARHHKPAQAKPAKPYVVTGPCDKYPCLKEINGKLVLIKEDTAAIRASVGDVDPKDPPDERTVQQKTRKNLAETREVNKNLGKSKSGKSLHEIHGDSLKGETTTGMLRDIHGALIPGSPFRKPNGHIVPGSEQSLTDPSKPTTATTEGVTKIPTLGNDDISLAARHNISLNDPNLMKRLADARAEEAKSLKNDPPLNPNNGTNKIPKSGKKDWEKTVLWVAVVIMAAVVIYLGIRGLRRRR